MQTSPLPNHRNTYTLPHLSAGGTWAVTALVALLTSYAMRIFLRRNSKLNLIAGSDSPSHLEVLAKVSTNIPKGPFEMGEVRVTKILVHPIKSCRGTSVPEVRYTPRGLENDRKWCIIDAQTNVIITAREVPRMVLIEPKLHYDPSSPYNGKLIVSVPDGEKSRSFSVPIEPTPDVLTSWQMIEKCSLFGTSIDGYVCQSLSASQPSPSQILSEYMGKQVHLVMKGPIIRPCQPTPTFPNLKASGVYQDGYPLLVTSEESLIAVAAAIRDAANGGSIGKIGGMNHERWKEGDIEMERFRPNIVVKGAGIPFAEDAWQKIAVGTSQSDESQSISLVSKCARCLLPNVDVKSGVRDAAVPYKVIMKFRTGIDPENMNKPCFGCNGVPGGNGVVRVGDLVTTRDWVA